MRKNDVRKWIHAGLDLLPLLVIPIFAIAVRSDNNFTPIEVQVENKELVDFNQLIKNGQPVSTDDWSSTINGQFSYSDNSFTITATANYSGIRQSLNLQSFHQYLLSVELYCSTSTNSIQFGLTDNFSYTSILPTLSVDNTFKQYRGIVTLPAGIGSSFVFLRGGNTDNLGITFNARNINVFDLTQMFGSGNEPTSTQFSEWFPDIYYDYTLSHIELINVGFETFNDTDVGSQMVYTLYNTCDKYFNFNNVFNFNQIYDWLTINIFNGQVPMSAFIAWNVFLYEFLMDLIFLMYALFMFFIDMCTNLIDRFTCQASGRRLK